MDMTAIVLGILVGLVLCAVIMGPYTYALSQVFKDLEPERRRTALRRVGLMSIVGISLSILAASGASLLFVVLVLAPFLLLYLGSLLQLRGGNARKRSL